jgi:hypothetical protein
MVLGMHFTFVYGLCFAFVLMVRSMDMSVRMVRVMRGMTVHPAPVMGVQQMVDVALRFLCHCYSSFPRHSRAGGNPGLFDLSISV